MEMDSMQELLVKELQDMYDAESQIIEAMPDMIDATFSPQLKKAFESHLQQTELQRERLRTILENMDEDTDGPKCKGMKGILDEGEEVIKLDANTMIKDNALIGAAKKVEHYEMAGYENLIFLAKQMKAKEIETMLKSSLKEEEATAKKLVTLAKTEMQKASSMEA